MNPSDSSSQAASPSQPVGNTWWKDPYLAGFAGFCVILSLCFLSPLSALVRHALKEDLHSHVLLIPVVSLYLASLKRGKLPACGRSFVPAAFLALLAGVIPMATGMLAGAELSHNDRISQWIACYVLLVVAGGFAFLGRKRVMALAFPFAFLVFMVPVPDAMVVGFEQFLMKVSAVVADWLFQLSGTPIYRVGQIIELPGMTMEVAQECSGIRSTWVLLITSVLASYLLLSSPWHRAILVAIVIPLGILRNGIRVLVIGLLCVHQGPHMIDSWIHHRGGPVFFAASLVPLLLLVGWLHWRESRTQKKGDSSIGKS